MATLSAGFLLAFLLSVQFTDTLQMNVSAVDKLVDYSLDMPASSLLPSVGYEGAINATFAVPSSALSGLEGKTITVKITAQAENNSSISFSTPFGASKTAEAYVTCDVVNRKCANTSKLWAAIPLIATAQPSANELAKLTLKSEIAEGLPMEVQNPGQLVDSVKGIIESGFSGSNNTTAKHINSSSGNFLDSLKPEGDSHDPLSFLRENPTISLAALAIVIVITGAYLLNAKD
jgi:hypothetical protein